MMLTSLFAVSLATEEDDSMYLYTNESGELVSSDDYGDDAVPIEDYDDFYNDYYSTLEEQDQETLKVAFENQSKSLTTFEEASEEDNVKLIVTEVLSDVKDYYIEEASYYYDSYYYIVKYQEVVIRNTEDGTETESIVILSYDVTDNKNVKPLKAGDTFYGYIEYATSEDEMYSFVEHSLTSDQIGIASITEKDRTLPIILLTIVVLVLLFIYAHKLGSNVIVPAVLLIDTLFVVLARTLSANISVLLIASVISISLILVISLLKNRLNRKAAIAICSSILVTFAITIFALIIMNAAGITGRGIISEESYDLESNVYYLDNLFKSKVNLTELIVSMIMIISAIITSAISSKLTDICEKYAGSKAMVNNILDEAKLQINEYPLIITGIILTLGLPQFMILIEKGIPFNQVINSETTITTLLTLLITLISSLIIVPITAVVANILMGNVEIKQIESKKESK